MKKTLILLILSIFSINSQIPNVLDVKPTESSEQIPMLSGYFENGVIIFSTQFDDLRFYSIHEKVVTKDDHVNLDTNDPVSVTISSTPSDAEIFIDELSKGKTRRALFLHPGSYKLRLTLPYYLSVEGIIIVTNDEKKNNFQYTLIKNTGKLKIDLKPVTATVRINNKEVKSSEEQELTPGTYQIEAEAAGYSPYKSTVEVKRGEKITEKIALKQKFGKLQFTINPPEAQCILSQSGVEKYRWTGLKIFSTIGEGTYDLSAKLPGYKSYTGKVIIKEGQKTIEDLQMTRGSDIPDWMIRVEGGTFIIGSNGGESNEQPMHNVTLDTFFIGKTEVTLGSFSKFILETRYQTTADKDGYSWVMRSGNWNKKSGVNWRCDTNGDRRPDSETAHPVIHISWVDAIAYCNWLSEKEGLQKAYSVSGENITCNFEADGYRLPTEAEWEYAARGGNKSKGYEYSGSNNPNEVGWYGALDNSGNSTWEKGTSLVGKRIPNELGIYDMSGNVYEWCWDWFDERYYSTSPGTNPRGPSSGSYRILRGGAWFGRAKDCRVTKRKSFEPVGTDFHFGFRLVRTK